jgi:hypothetical protein
MKDKNTYLKGINISDEEMDAINFCRPFDSRHANFGGITFPTNDT